MNYIKYFFLVGVVAIMSSCSAPKNTLYFQDITQETQFSTPPANPITLKPNDKVTITVNSRDKELAELVNLRQMEATSTSTSNRLGYTVDMDGNINFPIVGKIYVKGLTRDGLVEKIQNTLRNEGVVNDAIVTVEFQNLGVNVMGEVSKPGRVAIDRDALTLVEAISRAGDINISGQRDRVKVTRTADDGTLHTYIVDLTNASETFSSPVYYLQQDDFIYVEPNDKKRQDSTVNGNTLRSYSFWMSVASFLVSFAVLVFK